MELGQFLEAHLLDRGFVRKPPLTHGFPAAATFEGETESIQGESLREVIPTDGRRVITASVFLKDPDSGRDISLSLGRTDFLPFDANTEWESFLLLPSCRMDVRTMFDSSDYIPSAEELANLQFPRKIYQIAKELFSLTDAERCIGVDDKYFKGELWDSFTAFDFSRSHAWKVNEFLE